VLEAVLKVMRFWLDMGVDGFRLDAIPYLIERDGTNNENLRETHAVIKRSAPRRRQATGPLLLAEANSGPRTCASTSATATSATWPTTSR
jgi:maltose alpha-D-glucosyltransferase / alpha-amylase